MQTQMHRKPFNFRYLALVRRAKEIVAPRGYIATQLWQHKATAQTQGLGRGTKNYVNP